MACLEQLQRGASVKGVLPDGLVTVVDVQWHGSAVVELTYKDAAGRLGSELLYRDREPALEVAAAGRPWSFGADGAMLRLVSEAHRIRLAHLFDPLSRSIPLSWTHSPTRSPPSTARCCRGSRCASSSRTTPERERRSWPGC
jgi:hypothetical protein